MTDDFERWWAAMPKRQGCNPKAEARKVWDRLVRFKQLPPIDELMATTRAYALECVNTKIYGTSFVPHARTWLNQRRFESDAVLPQALPTPTQHPMILPIGYEDYARALIAEIGVPAYTAWFGKVKWSNGGDVIKIQCANAFDRSRIQANYVIPLERLTGKQVEVMT